MMTGTIFLQENAAALVFYINFSPTLGSSFLFVSLSCCYFCVCEAGAHSQLYQIFHKPCANISDDSHSPIPRVIVLL